MVPPLKLVLPSISVSEVNNMICSPKLPSLSQSQGPTKPPPPRKPLPADPHGRRPSKMSQEAKSQEIGMGWGKCFRLRP